MLDYIRLSNTAQADYNALSQGGKTRTQIMSLVVAKLLADRASLPSGPVEDIRAYYNNMVETNIKTALSKLQEVLLFDVPTIEDRAYKFYCLRYAAANPPRDLYCTNPEAAVADFFGLSLQVSPADLETISQNYVAVGDYSRRITSLLNDLVTPPSEKEFSTAE